jgi:glycosyltransferase involved in cell wall biosynthesis
MRVLLVVNTLPPADVSGVGEQVLQLADGLRSLSHQVEILGRGQDGARGPKIFFPLMVIYPFLRTCRQFQPDVVQVHESDGALAALALKTISAILDPQPKLMALLQVSYLEEIRAVRAIRWQGRTLGSPSLREWVFRWCKAPIHVGLGSLTGWLADLVLAPSRQTALELEHDYRLSGVRVLPNATSSIVDFDGSSAEKYPEQGYILFVGRLRIRKGVEVLLHAIAEVVRKGREISLVIVGDGEHRNRLETISQALGLEAQVRFVGQRARGEIAELMSNASALVVPSLYEGMPLVVLEAMRHSLPIVASRVSGIPEVVEDGSSGWLVAPENVIDLVDALISVIASPQEARRRGEIGRRWVEAEANPIRLAEKWTDLVGHTWPKLSLQKDARVQVERK